MTVLRVAAAALAALAAAAPASAQEPEIGVAYPEIVNVGPGQLRALRDTPVTFAGRLTVKFRGDAAAGCAITGVCGLAGTVTWRPPRRGELAVAESVQRGRRWFTVTLGVAGESVTTARVNRRGGDESSGRCSDATQFTYVAAVARARAGRAARISLPGANRLSTLDVDVLTTRCGGPLQGDLRAALPTTRLGRALPRPGSALDLRGRRRFAAHGFAGTVESTITVRVGRPERHEVPRSRLPRERVRAITARYAIERVEGGMTTTLTGAADLAACGRFDACGVTGTITSVFGQAREGHLTLIAAVEGRRPWRDLRAALGLTPRGRRRGVVVTGYGGWEGGPGSATQASIVHPGGGPPCSDSVPLRAGFVFLLPTEGAVTRVAYGNQPDALRTRCAGPRHDDLSPHDDDFATGEIPIRALASRRPVLRAARDVPFVTDGYAGSARIDFTLHLRRLRITRRTIVR